MKWSLPHTALSLVITNNREAHSTERRTFFVQLDGSMILGDLCTCHIDPFCCPIDRHSTQVRQKELNAWNQKIDGSET